MKQLIGLLLLVLFVSCYHKSELKTEKGFVVEKAYSPEFDGNGSGFGMTTGGHGVITSQNVHKGEQFILVFKCEHNTVFSIEQKQLYTNLNKGDSVDIKFYEILNKSGEIKDYEFVTATKIK